MIALGHLITDEDHGFPYTEAEVEAAQLALDLYPPTYTRFWHSTNGQLCLEVIHALGLEPSEGAPLLDEEECA